MLSMWRNGFHHGSIRVDPPQFCGVQIEKVTAASSLGETMIYGLSFSHSQAAGPSPYNLECNIIWFIVYWNLINLVSLSHDSLQPSLL